MFADDTRRLGRNAPKRKPCFRYLEGKCRFGKGCKFSHDVGPAKHDTNNHSNRINTTNGRQSAAHHDNGNRDIASSGGKVHQWRRMLARGSEDTNARISPTDVKRFFELALEIMDGDIGGAQDTIKRLAEEAGLRFIRELSDRHAVQTQPGAQASMTLWVNEMRPLFKLVTHPGVVDSSVLEQQVAVIYNFLYGIGGQRISRMSSHILVLVQSWPATAPESSPMEVIVLYLSVLSKILDCNTTAIVNPHFPDILSRFTTFLAKEEKSQLADDFLRLQASKYMDYMHQRIRIGDEMDQWQPSSAAAQVSREDFVLRRDLPGHLSAQGRRHDNDHAKMTAIKILPTPDEIMSPRGEYLPTTDPSTWHIKGIRGRLDREFRLLREDTVGQLRDTVRETLERLRKPREEKTQRSRNSVRVYTYQHATPVDIEVNQFGHMELVIRCQQPAGAQGLTVDQRREWWMRSKSLQAGALVCILDVKGMDLFCVVSDATMRTKDDKRTRYTKTTEEDAAALAGQQKPPPPTLGEDAEFLYVKLQLIDPTVYDIGRALRWYRNIGSAPTKHLVEFPGILLASFKHTLQALQHMYEKANVPFSGLLAPSGDGAENVRVEPACYARKPGFAFDLRCLMNDGQGFLVSPTNIPSAEDLEARSSLDLTQARAVINALLHEFGLIQGPPGTGKSYAGEKIIKVLLANKTKARLGPILCVCYTNHALDQLLEHLLDDGINRIIRIGSRSKSERLENMNIRAIARREDRTRFEKYELWNTKRAMGSIIEEKKKLLDQLAASDTWKAVKAHLEAENPRQHAELFGTGEDGWTKVDRKPERVLDRWLMGGGASSSQGTNRARQLEDLEQASLGSMSQIERRMLHRHWLKRIRDPLIVSIASLHDELKQLEATQDQVRGEVDLRCLQQADIVGVTTTGLARNAPLLRKLRCKVMLCEEAGEVLEAHTLTALLPSVEHAILIGDHLQLPPQIANYALQSTNPQGEQYSLDTSLFERLVKPRHSTTASAVPFNTLATQRRMHPSIAELVRSTLYPDLQDSESVAKYPEVAGMRKRLFWLHHEHLEAAAQANDPVSTSHANAFEVEMTTALVLHLVRQGAYAQGDIAVVTPYLGQLHRLRRRMESLFEICVNDRDLEDLEALEGGDMEAPAPAPAPAQANASKTSLLKSVRVATVDNFQGEEAKVIIISLVRSNLQGSCGFLSTPNRINVLLSRAKHGMYIIGNSKTCLRVPMWRQVIKMLTDADNLGSSLALSCPRHADVDISVSQPDHFLQFSPEGGCSKQCDKRLACGHSCSKRCHADVLHGAVKCLDRCVRPLKGCDHACPNACGDPCPKICRVRLKGTVVMLPCGHSVTSPMCYEAQHPEAVLCGKMVQRRVPGCNHQVTTPCHKQVTAEAYRCLAECGHIRPCGHTCKSPCHQCNVRKEGQVVDQNHGMCSQVCGRAQTTCRHACAAACHGDRPCPPCGQRCEVRCSHSRCSKLCSEPCAPCAEQVCQSRCVHTRCSMPCAAPCDWVPCSRRCEKMLSCEHRCPSLCGEPCPDVKYCQQCGSEAIKSTCVDFLEMKEYREIDLDEDPCIFPDCGHFLTASSMDGQMDMSAHYDMDINGHPSKVSKPLEPFAMDEAGVKVCATCRGSLRSVSRYGRIVRRAMLDEATKKFMTWTNARYVALAALLIARHEELEKLEWAETTPAKSTTSTPRKFTTAGSRIRLLESLQNLQGSKRYFRILNLRKEITSFSQSVRTEEQPFQKVADLVAFANRVHRQGQVFAFDESVLQVKGRLLATSLLLKCDIVVLMDFVRNMTKIKDPEAIKGLAEIRPDLTEHLRECEKMTELAQATQHPREELQSHIFAAQIYWVSDKFVTINKKQGVAETSPPVPNSTEHLSLLDSAREHIKQAQSLLDRYSSTAALRVEIDAVDALLVDGSYRPVTADEMRAVYNAMAREFSGTGHWYTCVNGHPFTIGECGMAMQEARCPECGATVGGRNHTAAAGVRRADDIEELGREVHDRLRV